MHVAGNGGYQDVMEVVWVGHGGGQNQGGIWVHTGDAQRECGAQGTKGWAVGGCPSTVNVTRPCSCGWGSIRAVLCRLGVAGVAPQVEHHRVRPNPQGKDASWMDGDPSKQQLSQPPTTTAVMERWTTQSHQRWPP